MGKFSVEPWCIIALFHTSRDTLSWVISGWYFLSLSDFVSAYEELRRCGYEPSKYLSLKRGGVLSVEECPLLQTFSKRPAFSPLHSPRRQINTLNRFTFIYLRDNITTRLKLKVPSFCILGHSKH
jgi:hypothetical protein